MNTMDAPTKDAVLGAGVMLVAFAACLWFLISHATGAGADFAPARAVLLGLGVAASIVAHLAFVGIAARRMGRSVLGWVLLALLTFPIGSIVTLIVWLWFSDAPAGRTAAR